MGLFDYEFQLEKIKAHQPPLQKLNAIIDWEIFREPIEKALYKEPKSNAGAKPYDRVMMFKIVILQRYYNLSDEQTEFQIKDRLSFMDFLGLRIGDKIPDAKTIWLFKERLSESNLAQTLFDTFTQKLIENGIVAKEGSIVDASFVRVPKQREIQERRINKLKKVKLLKAFKRIQTEKHKKIVMQDGQRRITKESMAIKIISIVTKRQSLSLNTKLPLHLLMIHKLLKILLIKMIKYSMQIVPIALMR